MASGRPPPSLPRPVIGTALVVLVGCLIWASVEARRTPVPGGLEPIVTATAEPLSERALRFHDRGDGGVAVVDANTDEVLAVVASGEGSFLRGVLRSLAHDRIRHELSPDVAFTLTRWDDGKVAIADPLTGTVIDLRAFGVDNIAAFARYLPPAGEAS